MLRLLILLLKLRKENSEFKALTLALLLLILSGIIFYRYVEKWSFIDAFYFCVMTISTIGYGDLTPTTPGSKLFTVFLALGGIGSFISLAAIVSKQFMDYYPRRKK